MQNYTYAQYLMFQLFDFINNKKIKLLILGIIVILFLISAVYYTLYHQNFIIINKDISRPKHRNKIENPKYKKIYILFFSFSIVIMMIFLIGYKGLKKVSVNPQKISIQNSKINK